MKMIDKLIFKISFVANFALLLFGIWTERNRNQGPDISVNVKDVLTIERID